MKVCIAQPPYYTDYSRSSECFDWEMKAFDDCDESLDVIVFPEACDVPCLATKRPDFLKSIEAFNEKLLKKASETAKRCSALTFVNATEMHGQEAYNTTFAFNRQGERVGVYHKLHPTPSEAKKCGLSPYYDHYSAEPTILEIEGLRFAFLTCYDFYFYENFGNIARYEPDIIIGCSHQRSDKHSALEIITRFLAYNTNAYVIRSSVSMDENSEIGGCSMIVSPDGEVLCDMKSAVGLEYAEIDPKAKYYKAAGFGNEPSAHWQYIENGRRTWKYRPMGPATCLPDAQMPYPRICAHRGFNTVAPENSMPAFASAISLGADEIEFDLWVTSDGEIVSTHDRVLERTSNGSGFVYEHTLEELRALDFGSKFSDEFKGLKIVLFEEILRKFARQCIMNIHIKSVDEDKPHKEEELKKIISLIKAYDCEQHVYFMTNNNALQKQLGALAPEICRCQGATYKTAPWNIVDDAIENGCQKLQFFKPYITQEMVDKAHAHGIICNVFYADDLDEAKKYLEMGIDTILTNDYKRISSILQK